MSKEFISSGGSDTNVNQCDNGLGKDECNWCCTNIAWQNRWKNQCPKKMTQSKCQANNKCGWVACSDIGECNWDRGDKGSQNVCKKLTDVTSCEAKTYCLWTYTNPNPVSIVNLFIAGDLSPSSDHANGGGGFANRKRRHRSRRIT